MANEIVPYTPNEEGVVIYRTEDNTLQLDVQLANNTVWLTQQQMTVLFDTTKQNISLHINNIFKEGELSKDSVVKDYLTTAADGKSYRTLYYNLDVIISVGYRVKSKRGTQFRQWATKVLNEYMIRGYAANQRLLNIENQLAAHQKQLAQHQEQIDFFVRTSLPPVEQVFYNGEFFEARALLEKIIKTAKTRVIIIDGYIDASTFEMLDVRAKGIKADIYSGKNLSNMQKMHNTSSGLEPIDTHVWKRASHDRWLIVDDRVYHCGPSLKDMGQKLCAVSLLSIDANDILKQVR